MIICIIKDDFSSSRMCLIDLPAAFVIAAVRAFGVNADR